MSVAETSVNTSPADLGPATARPLVPVTILTGFLGAGKTTLLNRILGGDHGLRVAVLVNDFGTINIDAELVVGVENGGDVISLANGCVCCNIRDDLLAAVWQATQRPERPEYIVLEASGVAEPSGIAATFLDARLRDRIRLDSIMCVVDAEQVLAAPEMMELKLRQMAFADMIILNKTDLVDRAHVGRIRSWLDDRFHRYRLVESTRGDVPLEVLLSVGRFDPAVLDGGAGVPDHHQCLGAACGHSSHRGHDHSAQFSTWTYRTDRALSMARLGDCLRRLPASIYRCKGVVHAAESDASRTVVQVVGKRVEASPGGPWNGGAPCTRIVAIGAPGAIDAARLQEMFDACLV